MKLYEISEQIRELFSTEELDIERFEALELAFNEKVENACAVIRELEADAAGYKSEIDRLADHKRRAENAAERLKDYIRANMEATGEAKITGKLFTVTLGKPSQVVAITGTVPEQYQVVKVTEDKTAISKALKAGETVEGAQLVDGKAKLIIK